MEPTSFPPADRPGRRPGSGQRTVWGVFGTILAVLLVMAGLAVVAGFVLFTVAMSQVESNK